MNFPGERPRTPSSMANLKIRITDDMKLAMKARDTPRLSAIRLLLAAVKQREVDERRELEDADVVAVIDKMVKQRKDAIEQFTRAGRQDLVDKEQAELLVINDYLPQRLTAAEVHAAVAALVQEVKPTGPADMGKLMAAAKAKLAGHADMGEVAAAVKQALAGSR